MVKQKKPPSQTWRTFLKNHAKDLVSIDFFTVLTVKFNILFVFVVLANNRRKLVHFNITENPTAQWTAQQIVEAFPWNKAPEYLNAVFWDSCVCFPKLLLKVDRFDVS